MIVEAKRPLPAAASPSPAPALARRTRDDDRPTPLRWERRANAMPRAQIEDVLVSAKALSLSDRALVDGVYRHGMSVATMAKATGSRPHQLRRRLRRIMRRIRSPLFRYVVRCEALRAISPPRGIRDGIAPDVRLAIARAIVIERKSQREVARQFKLTLHQVRRDIARLEVLAEHA